MLAEALPSTGYGLRPARIVERLGVMGEPKSVSLVCIHAHGPGRTSGHEHVLGAQQVVFEQT